MPNMCMGDEPRGDVDVFDSDGNWVTAWAKCAGCFADYLIEDWGEAFGWASWRWRYGDPATTPQPGEESPLDPAPNPVAQ
ncbi:hypothetical protein GTP58_24400 [Duganella sp. CY15W]|uniref:hypothetical protein n=1 Tax=Duganella sp. CY15W TaxID=2692172 RepID=UPI00136C37AF|nr:hypothetical protein [Duganella sp. CY15W]MYM31479.1 hypothetical protein [Duganella sp. CY15W]